MDPDLTRSLRLPHEFLSQFLAAAQQHGFQDETFGEVGGLPLVALTKRAPGPRPRVYVSAGIHGDEPAPPQALRLLLDRGVFDHRAVWFLCPMLNPRGFLTGSRESPDGIDLNRDYRSPSSAEVCAHTRWLEHQPPFDLAICLHEDWEAHGFYIYELNRAHAPRLGPSHARGCRFLLSD